MCGKALLFAASQASWTSWDSILGGALPADVFMIGDCPHEWLFDRVSAVVHHGGAGTVAAGLRAGRPTLVCPFFGDQFFWGALVYRCGAGPLPIAVAEMTEEKLATAFSALLKPETIESARRLAVAYKQVGFSRFLRRCRLV